MLPVPVPEGEATHPACTRPPPARYTDTATADSGRGGGSTWGTSSAATSGWGIASPAGAGGGSSGGSAAGTSFWDANPTMPGQEAGQEAAPEGEEEGREGAPLQSRLASMEAQLKRITNLLERQWASRRGVSGAAGIGCCQGGRGRKGVAASGVEGAG